MKNKAVILILVASVIYLTFAFALLKRSESKPSSDWVKITDNRGQVWKIRKSDARAITPDFTDTNIFRIWLSQGMTICVDFENRRQAERLILETE